MLTDVQEINTLELTKLPKADDDNKLWRWLRLLMLKKEDEMEEVAGDNNVMKNVIVHLCEMSANETERRLAEEAEKRRRDIVASRMYGEKIGEARGLEQGEKKGLSRGRKEGEEKGLTRGRKEGALEIARNMKTEGSELSFIMKVTGLTEKDIDAL